MAGIKPYFTYGKFASDRDLITSTTMYEGVHKRYFSSLDAEIFLGEERLLDIARIEFMYEEKKLPYYGFNSFMPSKIFVGQKIIQGSFTINFTQSGYIAKLLQRIKGSELQKEYDFVGQACSDENAPLFNLQFDIIVGFGGHNVPQEASFNNTYVKLEGVSVNGFQQMLDTSGTPVAETYSFLARNIKFDGFKYPKRKEEDVIYEEQGNDIVTSAKRQLKVVEKRIENDVLELRKLCSKNNKVLGVVVNVIHSLHKKGDKSHIYVDFEEQLNSDKNNKISGRVTLTFSDNGLNLKNEYSLDYTPNTVGHYGVAISAKDTELIKKRFSGQSQNISCFIKFDYILDGQLYKDKKVIVHMIKGLGY